MAVERYWTDLLQGVKPDIVSQDQTSKIYISPKSKFGGEVVIKQTFCETEEVFNRKILEGQVAMENPHPNIMEVLEYTAEAEYDGMYVYVIMRKYPNDLYRDCNYRKKQSPADIYSEDRLWQIASQVVQALAFLQRKVLSTQEFAHRDIKPQNILLDAQGTVKMCDFGFVRKVDTTALQAFTLAGTQSFFSPALRRAFISGEQNFGRVQHNVYKSDVYSLGVTMLFLSTLDMPSFSASLRELQANIESEVDPIPYSDIWKQLLLRMMTVDEDRRPDFIELEEEVTKMRPKEVEKGPEVCYASDEVFEVRPPPDQEGDPLQITVRCGFSVVGVDSTHRAEVPCMVTITAPSLIPEEYKSGADIVCLIDVSGSMAGARIQRVKNILHKLQLVLRSNDRVSIVAFSDEAKMLCPLVPCRDDAEKKKIAEAIEALRAEGNTNIAKGVAAAIKIITDRTYVNNASAILFFSDGEDNKGEDPVSICMEATKQLQADHALSVHTFGYGTEIDENLLRGMAAAGKGEFHNVHSESDILEAFALTLADVKTAVAFSVTVKLTSGLPPVPCKVAKIYSKDGQDSYSIPRISVGQIKDLVFIMTPECYALEDDIDAAPITADVEYVTNTQEVITRSVPMQCKFVRWEDGKNPSRDQAVYANWCRAKGAESILRARDLMREEKEREAIELLQHTQEFIHTNSPQDNPLVKKVLEDVENVIGLIPDKETWMEQGESHFTSVAYSHYTQNPVARSADSYRTAPQDQMREDMAG